MASKGIIDESTSVSLFWMWKCLPRRHKKTARVENALPLKLTEWLELMGKSLGGPIALESGILDMFRRLEFLGTHYQNLIDLGRQTFK